MQQKQELLAKWQSRGGKYWIELYADIPLPGTLPGYSYKGDNCGGYIGTVAPEVAMQHAAQQAGYAPSKMPRVFYSEVVAARCCEAWQQELAAR